MDSVKINPEYLMSLDGKDSLSVAAIEGAILCDLVKKHKPKIILEVGTGHGYSSAWMLLAMGLFTKLYTVDEVNRPQIAEDKRIIRLSGTLEKVYSDIPKNLDLIFLDSDHQIDKIALDIERLEPKMKTGTIVAVHDTIYCDEMGRCLKDYFAGLHSDRLKTIGIGPSKLTWTHEALPTQYGLDIAILGEAQHGR